MSSLIPGLRLKSILLYLANSPTIVTTGQIAEEIGVSRRTVLRDMQEVENWLRANGFELYIKTGKGVSLKGGEKARKRLAGILNDKVPEVVNIPKDRQKMLLAELLQMREPVKLYCYTSRFGVSASTLSNDLDRIEEWLVKFDLSLVRKAGTGVYISGEEKDFRRAIISLLYENLSEEELIGLVKNKVAGIEKNEDITRVNVRNQLLNLIDGESIEKLENIFVRLEEKLPYRLVESARIGLMVHLALAIKRIKCSEEISIDRTLLDQLKKKKEYLLAGDLAKELADKFSIDIPEDEIGYITMHLNGARIYNSTPEDEGLADKKDLFDLAKEMIEVAQRESKVDLSGNEKLLYDLVCHLDPAVRRLKMDLDIRNPLLERIKQLFPDAYNISMKAAEVLKSRMAIDIPESEIGYLAMHFGAAMEKNKSETKSSFRIIVACPSGIGTSRLLSARLEKEFKDLEIVDILSTSEISRDYLINNKVDYVISTIPMQNCAVKSVCVNPLLTEEDKDLVKKVIYGTEISVTKHDADNPGINGLRESIKSAADYSSFIFDILKNHYVLDTEIDAAEDLKAEIPERLSFDSGTGKAMERSLKNKDDFIVNENCAVAICCLKNIDESRMILCRAGKDLIGPINGRAPKLLVLLLIPERIKNTHSDIIRDFCENISGNMKISSGPEDANELTERFLYILRELYASKLDEWRHNII